MYDLHSTTLQSYNNKASTPLKMSARWAKLSTRIMTTLTRFVSDKLVAGTSSVLALVSEYNTSKTASLEQFLDISRRRAKSSKFYWMVLQREWWESVLALNPASVLHNNRWWWQSMSPRSRQTKSITAYLSLVRNKNLISSTWRLSAPISMVTSFASIRQSDLKQL